MMLAGCSGEQPTQDMVAVNQALCQFSGGMDIFMQMELPTILSSALGLSPPWEVKAVALSKEQKRLDITVDIVGKMSLACPTCGSAGNHCLTRLETWHHGSFLDYATYLHARVPQVECCGAVVPVERPWSRQGSKFALLC